MQKDEACFFSYLALHLLGLYAREEHVGFQVLQLLLLLLNAHNNALK